MPFDEVVGSAGILFPWHIVKLFPKANVVVTFDFTVTLKELVVAH